jgi:hypothetical protein
MKLLMCHCMYCKHGRQKGPWDAMVKQKKTRARMKVKQLLRDGEYDNLPVKVAIGYTD